MARYKLIRPTIEAPEYKLAKKRERIVGIVSGIWAALIVIGICIGGLCQDDDLITGWTMLVLGLITLSTTLFCVYTLIANWEPLLRGDSAETWRFITKQEREKRLAKHRAEFGIIVVLLGALAIGMIIVGLRRLLGII